LSSGAAALLVTLAIAAGWHTARFHRARKDIANAQDNVKKAERNLTIERKPFLLIAGIALIVAWWWIHKHAG
jgi:hypothetical protein